MPLGHNADSLNRIYPSEEGNKPATLAETSISTDNGTTDADHGAKELAMSTPASDGDTVTPPATAADTPQAPLATAAETPQTPPATAADTPHAPPATAADTPQAPPATAAETPHAPPATAADPPQAPPATAAETPQAPPATAAETPQAGVSQENGISASDKPDGRRDSWVTNNIAPTDEEDEDDSYDNISIKSADLRWIPPPEPKRFNLCFAGCGFLGIYHLGVASVLMRNGKEFLSCVEKFGGASAGVLVASVLSVRGVDEEALEGGINFCQEAARSVHKRKLGLMTPGFSVLDSLEVFLRKVLPLDSHKVASGRLYVSMTQLGRKRKNILQSEFEEYDDLIQKYIDGGMTENLPQLPGARTILVSPFSGGAEIAPRDKSIRGMVCRIHGQDFLVHPNNLLRGLHAFFPPSLEYLNMYYDKGVRDATYFLKKEGMYEGPKGGGSSSSSSNKLQDRAAAYLKNDISEEVDAKMTADPSSHGQVGGHIINMAAVDIGMLDVSFASVDSAVSVQYETAL